MTTRYAVLSVRNVEIYEDRKRIAIFEINDYVPDAEDIEALRTDRYDPLKVTIDGE